MKARAVPGPAWVAAVAILAIGAGACGSGSVDKAGGPVSRPVVLTLADPEVDTSNAQPFASAVARLSNGALQINIKGDWRPSDPSGEADLITDVQAGKAQLGITPARAFDTVGIDSFQALQAPFLIDNYPLERKILASAIPGQMLAALRPHGLTGLAVLPGPLRRPLGFTRPLVAAASYRGARIAIRPSVLDADIFRALGAIPATFYRTLGPGSIAGLTGNVVFEPRANVIFMNSRAFGALTPSQRTELAQAAVRARAAGIYEGNDTASVADLCR